MIEIRTLTLTTAGTYDEGADMAADMLNGDPMPGNVDDAYTDWLYDEDREKGGGATCLVVEQPGPGQGRTQSQQ